jgi:glycosyltransferase involved in cell wall biosynthesis
MIGSISQETKQDLLNLATNIESIEIIGELPYEEIITNMLSCDVFVLPTYTEGFPNVILESMATSCAIVTTNVGAIPEILESDNGQDFGIMVEPRDINSLQKAIEQMLSDEEFKANCRANVARRVIERYSLHTIWLKMLDIWG